MLFDSSVTDGSFVDEMRVWRKYKISFLVTMMSLFSCRHLMMFIFLIRFARICTNLFDFNERHLCIEKLWHQGFGYHKLVKTFYYKVKTHKYWTPREIQKGKSLIKWQIKISNTPNEWTTTIIFLNLEFPFMNELYHRCKDINFIYKWTCRHLTPVVGMILVMFFSYIFWWYETKPIKGRIVLDFHMI